MIEVSDISFDGDYAIVFVKWHGTYRVNRVFVKYENNTWFVEEKALTKNNLLKS